MIDSQFLNLLAYTLQYCKCVRFDFLKLDVSAQRNTEFCKIIKFYGIDWFSVRLIIFKLNNLFWKCSSGKYSYTRKVNFPLCTVQFTDPVYSFFRHEIFLLYKFWLNILPIFQVHLFHCWKFCLYLRSVMR